MRRVSLHRDKSEPEIVKALEALGWKWCPVYARNKPDGFAAKGGRTVAIENKTGKAKLRPGQQQFFDTWPGEKAVLRSVEDVIALNQGE
jgi:hypothetical protein